MPSLDCIQCQNIFTVDEEGFCEFCMIEIEEFSGYTWNTWDAWDTSKEKNVQKTCNITGVNCGSSSKVQ